MDAERSGSTERMRNGYGHKMRNGTDGDKMRYLRSFSPHFYVSVFLIYVFFVMDATLKSVTETIVKCAIWALKG